MNFSYGLEVELSEIDRKTPLTKGLSFSKTEVNIVSRCGAIDPKGKLHTIGGEINTAPTDSIESQVELFKEMMRIFPNAETNHRNNTHYHISLPGIKDNLEVQKKLLKWFHVNTKTILENAFVYSRHPDMLPTTWAYLQSDMGSLTPWRYEYCMNANTPQEFFEGHAKVKDGRIFYMSMKRMSFNLYSIKKHGTIEMRCGHTTLNVDEIRDGFRLFHDLVAEALSDKPRPVEESIDFSKYKLAKEVPYNHELELLWHNTCKKKK